MDPIASRDTQHEQARAEAARSVTFRHCAKAYMAARADGWKNAKSKAQWEAALETYAMPIIGDLPVQAVDVALVHNVLEPIWSSKTETASRVRGRIEAILDWAKVRGYRCGDNPARWKGHLDNLFPTRSKVQKVEHHAALPYGKMGAFMATLKAQQGNGALARSCADGSSAACRTCFDRSSPSAIASSGISDCLRYPPTLQRRAQHPAWFVGYAVSEGLYLADHDHARLVQNLIAASAAC